MSEKKTAGVGGKIYPMTGSSDSNVKYASVHLEGNPTGLTDNVSALAQKPNDVLSRNLLAGEVVLREFDCFFPTEFIPRWKIVQMIIMTCGLYLFIMAYRAFMRMLYRNRCCTPKLVEFGRGKLAVTNRGRIICWRLSGNQTKTKQSCGCIAWCLKMCCCGELCAAPVTFELETQTRVYNARHIRQMTQFYGSDAACICCCLDYECGFELSFNEYNTGPRQHGVSIIESRNSYAFIAMLRSLLGAPIRNLEAWKDLTENDHLLHIVSGTSDLVHNGDVHGATNLLCELQQQIVEVLPAIDDILVSSNLALTEGNFSFSDGLAHVRVVSDDGRVTIPRKWMPLLRDEKILAVSGQMYRMNCMDWIKSVLSCGYYYCSVVHRKKYYRAALVLTNKRIIEVSLYQRTGTVPSNLHNCLIRVTAYLPGEITGGYMVSAGHDRGVPNLTSSILTSGGELFFSFYSGIAALPFAKAMHMSAARVEAGNDIQWPLNKTYAGHTDDLKNFAFLPLMHNEVIRSKMDSVAKLTIRDFQPFCSQRHILSIYNSMRTTLCCAYGVANICSKESIGCFFPWLPYCLTLAYYPLIRSQEVVVTDTAVMGYVVMKNFGFCSFRCTEEMDSVCSEGYFPTHGEFVVSWSLITDFVGHNLNIKVGGKENCMRRCFKCVPLVGSLCCPISKSSYALNVDVGQVNYVVSGQTINHNWNHDETLTQTLAMLNDVHHAVDKKHHLESVKRGAAGVEDRYPVAAVVAEPMMDLEQGGVKVFEMDR